MINLCGVYHHDADVATAECTGLFGSLLSKRWMDALGVVVFHKDDLRMPGTAISGVGAVLVMTPTKSRDSISNAGSVAGSRDGVQRGCRDG